MRAAEEKPLRLNVGSVCSHISAFTAVETGAYFLLLIEFGVKGSLPDSDEELARIVGMRLRDWAKISDHVMEPFSSVPWWERDDKTWAQLDLCIGLLERRPAIPLSVKAEVAERDGGACVYCGNDKGPFDLDHVVPWSRGGQHTADNLVLACRPCNRSKGARTPTEWKQ